MTLQPAVPELVRFAAATRTDWDADDLDAAILAALQAGWEWDEVYREVHRLLLIEDGSPASLRAKCKSVFKVTPTGRTTYQRGAAMARELLEHRNGLIGGSGDAA